MAIDLDAIFQFIITNFKGMDASTAGILVCGSFLFGASIPVVYSKIHQVICSIRVPDFQSSVHHPKKKPLPKEPEPVVISESILLPETQPILEPEPKESVIAVPEPIKPPKPEELSFNKNIYLEQGLNYEQKEKLFAKGYKRLKISPFGNSGASYYWVRKRYNESKIHSFFCYLIEDELRKYTEKVKLFIIYGPDVAFEHNGKKCCFDVETGKSLSRQPEFLKKKFGYYQKEYDLSYILVVNKSLKRKYRRFGLVITRSKIKETIEKIERFE